MVECQKKPGISIKFVAREDKLLEIFKEGGYDMSLSLSLVEVSIDDCITRSDEYRQQYKRE